MQTNSPTGSFKYFQELSENISQVIFSYHTEAKKFTYLSPGFEQLWNKPADRVLTNSASLLEMVHPEDREYLAGCYKDLLEGERKKTIEFRVVKDEGTIRWFCLSGTKLVVEAPDKHVLIGMVEDISEVKEHYAVLEKFAAKKNSILEILSHDLAGPLVNIKGISDLLSEEAKNYRNPNLDRMIGMISKTSERSIRLIREFIKQEFLASANSSFTKKRVNIVQKIKDSLDQYKSAEEALAKTFRFSASAEEIFMEADDYKFVQVINNLISNSLKFTHDGGTISVNIEEKKDHVLFTVADNGIGIPAKYHDSLFERFNKARRPGLKGEPSVGLGMSIIKTIVEWHEGKIWFRSRENEGTTFYIELPKK